MEQRRRALPARLVVYFVLALWLFRGRNCGYGQVMTKLADGLYHQRRTADLLSGQLAPDGRVDAGGGRRWRQPDVSNLSRGRGKLGPGPQEYLFAQVAGPTGDDGAPGASCCGLRAVSVDGSVTDVPDSDRNGKFFGRPSNQSLDGAFPQARWVVAAESGTGSLLGAAVGRYTDGEQSLALDLLDCLRPGMLVLADRNSLSWSVARDVLATGPASCGAPPPPSPSSPSGSCRTAPTWRSCGRPARRTRAKLTDQGLVSLFHPDPCSPTCAKARHSPIWQPGSVSAPPPPGDTSTRWWS
jgi:hypothetical protein